MMKHIKESAFNTINTITAPSNAAACTPQSISCLYKKNITNITYTIIQDEIYNLQTNLANIKTLSSNDKLSQVNTTSIYNNVTFTATDILSDQSIGYWQMIDSISSWLASSPIINMLNLASGFTCDVDKHIDNINIALEAYTSCISEYEEINVQFNYDSGYFNSLYNCTRLSDCSPASRPNLVIPNLEKANYHTTGVLDAKGDEVIIIAIFYDSWHFCSAGKEFCNFGSNITMSDTQAKACYASGSGGAIMHYSNIDTVSGESNLQFQYICPMIRNDLNNLAESIGALLPLTQTAPGQPVPQNCTSSTYSDVTSELNAFSECVINNDYNGFIAILTDTMIAILEQYINVDCDTKALQCLQDYANSVFL